MLGAFLLIQAQRNDSIITGNRLFQALGQWSYSIYLWHWPIVVAIYYFSLNEWFIYLGLILSLFLGFISFKYIESIKFRSHIHRVLELFTLKPFYMVLSIGVLSSAIFLTQGVAWHYSDKVVLAANEANNRNPYKCMVEKKFPCVIGNKDNIKAIIVGDSHADALTTSLASAFNLDESGIIALVKSSCPFILGVKSIHSGMECLEENERRLVFLKQKPYSDIPVFWVARSTVYLKGQSNPQRVIDARSTKPSIYFSDVRYERLNKELLNEMESALELTLNEINKKRTVFIVLPTPEMRTNVPKKISRSLLFGQGNNHVSIDKSLYTDRNREVIALFDHVVDKISNIKLLDPTHYLCDANTCYGDFKGRPFYYDGDHMSEFGNKRLTPMFLSAMK